MLVHYLSLFCILIVFGNRIRELRKEKGWSQEELALRSGLDRSYVGGVERGVRNIALNNIFRLAEETKTARYMGVTRNTLIYRMQKFGLKTKRTSTPDEPA